MENFVVDKNTKFLQQALLEREQAIEKRKNELIAKLKAQHSSESNIYVIAGEEFEIGTPVKQETKPDEDAIYLYDKPSNSSPVNYSAPSNQDSGITMVLIPVEHKIISNQSEYNKLKKQYKGSYPDVNFAKKNLIYITPANGMPNSMIRIIDSYKKDDKQVIEYITSVAALAQQNLPPTYIVIEKTNQPIYLLQVPYRE